MVSETPELEYAAEIEDPDRDRGILSKRDREFLLDESYRDDLAPQSRRNVRSRLRNRVQNAILDFYLLDAYLDDRDRDRVFSEPSPGLREGLHGTMAFLYQGADSNTATFESWLEGGLTHIELEHMSRLLVDSPSVDLTITPGQSVDPEEVEAKMEAGSLHELTTAELRYLLWRVAKLFGDPDADNPCVGALGEFANRFEEQTPIADAREYRETLE